MSSSARTNPLVSVLIVNYNTEAYLSQCLNSLSQQIDIDYEVLIVDNNSIEQEQFKLQQYACDNIKILQSPINLGFGRANNLAAQHATGEYLLILNPDTILDSTNLLKKMVTTLANSHHALLSPLIDEHEKNKVVKPRYSYSAQKQCRFSDFSVLKGEIAWVLGACMLIRHSDYLKINGFDQDFFMYGEDADFCFRIRKHIGSIGFAPDIVIRHIGGASEKQSPTLEKWIRKRDGLFLFYKKNYDPRDVYRILQSKKFSAYLTLSLGWIKRKINVFNQTNEQAEIKARATLQAIMKMQNKVTKYK